MTEIYLATLIALLAAILLKGLAAPVRFYEFPYFMAGVFAVFILPQTFALIRFPQGATPQGIESAMLMTLLCASACVIGYYAPVNRWIVGHVQTPLDDDRLFRCGILLIACGFAFSILIGQMSDAEKGGSMWTGKVTIYLFFAALTYPGFSICFRHALMHGGNGAWLWAIMGAWPPIVSGIFFGRREPSVLFALTAVMTLFYQRRFVLPRWAAILALLAVTVGIPATTQYRMALSGNRGFSAVTKIDVMENFRQFLTRPVILELRNAAMIIDATSAIGDYGMGAAYWDQLVLRFVPAQILGKEFKQSLMVSSSEERTLLEMSTRGYKVPVGSTITGMADSFREFGYLGCLFFAGLAVVFKSLWKASLKQDAVFAQLLYMQTATSAMRAVTHQTIDYPPGLIYNLIFLGLAAIYSRKRATDKVAPRMKPALR